MVMLGRPAAQSHTQRDPHSLGSVVLLVRTRGGAPRKCRSFARLPWHFGVSFDRPDRTLKEKKKKNKKMPACETLQGRSGRFRKKAGLCSLG